MNSISLPLPIPDGYLRSRIFNKPVVAIVAIACAIIIAVGIYLLKRSGYSLGFSARPQSRTPDSLSPAPQIKPQQGSSLQEEMGAPKTPVLSGEKCDIDNVIFRFDNPDKRISIPGAVIDFAEQTKAHHIQLSLQAPHHYHQRWTIICERRGYEINGLGEIKVKLSSRQLFPWDHPNSSRLISLTELIDDKVQNY